jgi:hypothetical protein
VISVSLDAQTGELQSCSFSARSKEAMQKTQEEDEVIVCFPKTKQKKLETSLWFQPQYLFHFQSILSDLKSNDRCTN